MPKQIFINLKNKLYNIPEQKLLLLLALVVGLLSGLAAVILKQLVHLVQWVLTGWFNTPSDSILYFVYPGIGMLLALLFFKFVIKSNIGHGVTHVLLALSNHESMFTAPNISFSG